MQNHNHHQEKSAMAYKAEVVSDPLLQYCYRITPADQDSIWKPMEIGIRSSSMP